MRLHALFRTVLLGSMRTVSSRSWPSTTRVGAGEPAVAARGRAMQRCRRADGRTEATRSDRRWNSTGTKRYGSRCRGRDTRWITHCARDAFGFGFDVAVRNEETCVRRAQCTAERMYGCARAIGSRRWRACRAWRPPAPRCEAYGTALCDTIAVILDLVKLMTNV